MLPTQHWQLQSAIDAVIFDCDGTLSTIEGINELADENHAGEKVKLLTNEAMTHSGINPDLYRKRLDLVMPHKHQVEKLGNTYFQKRVLDAADVIRILQMLGKPVYLVSAGLYPSVRRFGELLQVPAENVFAVDVYFTNQGDFLGFDDTSPLTRNDGKRQIVERLTLKHSRIAHIGDGMNDISAMDLTARFIGYGGVYFRQSIADRCEYYITTESLSPLLPLLLTPSESHGILPQDLMLYEKGLSAIKRNEVWIQPSRQLDQI